ncbi:PREDICTED: ATP-binding cassette sub-family B member 8, mitochondrial [Gekko japonicus]|uniref:Mitochondrial potassium channel ATP-binding subunit n=1 Tax=Gekko japonicus TaxID=146911 RepID=A0ABM1KRX1_GEKJA|nr:PREDICTED: ATP-binding cassette sub-family B member 8, mitochondrial [Gekko japonicus]
MGATFRSTALCQEVDSDVPACVSPAAEKLPDFDWATFWKFLRPQLLALTGGVQFALGVALLNVQIPLVLGDVVNVVAHYTGLGNYLRLVHRPAMRLLSIYALQVAKATAVADEALGNVRTVRAFAMEDREMQLYSAEVDRSGRLNMNLGLGIAVFQGLSNLALNCEWKPGLGCSPCDVGLRSPASRGGGCCCTPALGSGNSSCGLKVPGCCVPFHTLQVVRGMSAGARVFEYMTLTPETPLNGGQRLACRSLRGDIQFQGVCFSYPTRPGYQVLQDFCLSIPSNKTVAIVGESGGGKSQVAALLERFYDPTAGTISLDGQDISTLDPSWLRGEVIGFINQEPVLFSTSIMENIRFGKPDASDAEVHAAALLANADSFIRSFPEGYNTVVGERGVTLSGGQKQRVAIARALIKNPTVLILDEATSALDAESEHVVQEALDRAVAGRTVLVIAHRLSTVQAADLIVVLAKGRVAEAGSHAELLRRGGLYAELICRQTRDAAAA